MGVAQSGTVAKAPAWAYTETFARVFQVQHSLDSLGPGVHELREIGEKVPQLNPSTLVKILITGTETDTFRRQGRGMYEFGSWHEPPCAVVCSVGGRLEGAARLALDALREQTGAIAMLHGTWTRGTTRYFCDSTSTGGRPEFELLLAEHGIERRGATSLLLGAAGHAILAWLAPHSAERIRQGSPRAALGALWSEPLREDLAAIVNRGYAQSVSPDGWETLATPLLSAAQVTGAVSITFRTGQPPERHAALVRALSSTAPFIQTLLET
jgi:DNA-binding IclR family transcriptional regulator